MYRHFPQRSLYSLVLELQPLLGCGLAIVRAAHQPMVSAVFRRTGREAVHDRVQGLEGQRSLQVRQAEVDLLQQELFRTRHAKSQIWRREAGAVFSLHGLPTTRAHQTA